MERQQHNRMFITFFSGHELRKTGNGHNSDEKQLHFWNLQESLKDNGIQMLNRLESESEINQSPFLPQRIDNFRTMFRNELIPIGSALPLYTIAYSYAFLSSTFENVLNLIKSRLNVNIFKGYVRQFNICARAETWTQSNLRLDLKHMHGWRVRFICPSTLE